MAKQPHSHPEHPPHVSETLIVSRNNATIKDIRALLKRSERQQTGLALIEGLRLVTEALQHPHRVCSLIVAP